ncbi:hypothetical protein Tco_1027445, partial [Tanacetum coccineum]
FAPKLKESAGGLPKSNFVSHFMLPGRVHELQWIVSIPLLHSCSPGREHECNERFQYWGRHCTFVKLGK